MPESIEELCAVAERYRALGYKPIPLTDGKSPKQILEWQNREFDADEIRAILEKAEKPGIGLQMGPCCPKPIVDCEFDSAAQERLAREILGDDSFDRTTAFERPDNPGRGHRIFDYDARLAAIGKANLYLIAGTKTDSKGKTVEDKLVIRIGVGPHPGTQSAFPPSPNKIYVLDRDIESQPPLKLTDAQIDKLLELAEPSATPHLDEADQNESAQYGDEFKIAAAVDAMLHATKNMEDHNDGSKRMKTCVDRAYDESLTEDAAVIAFRRYAEQRPFPNRHYDDDRIKRELRTIITSKRPRKPQSKRFYKCTDHGNAERFAAQHAENVRFCHDLSKWFVWDGTRWKADNCEQVINLAKKTARSIEKEAEACDDSDIAKTIKAWAKKSDMRSGMDNMLRLARSQQPLPISLEDLDADPHLLNFENGTVDLRTGELRKHNRDDLITRCCPCEYGGEGRPEKFIAWLNYAFEGNQKLIDFLQRDTGSMLSGETGDQGLTFHDGGGENGKSTYFQVVYKAIGKEYMIVKEGNFLTVKKHEQHPTELADLFGARIVISFESAQDAVLDEARVKWLTGGDRIRARFCFRDNFEFAPTHSLRIATNHRPRIVVGGHAMWRRVRVLLWGVTVPKEKQVDKFEETFKDELGLIAKWLVDGYLMYRTIGLDPPPEVLAATAEYEAESDLLARFFSEKCELGKRYSVPFADLYSQWCFWLEINNERPESRLAFAKRMKTRQDIEKREVGHAKTPTFIGIKLDTQEDFT